MKVMKEESEQVPKRPSFLHRPVWWANGLALGVLLLTYLAPHVSPRTLWLLALLAMTFPYQLVVHLAFLLWWFLFRRKRMLLSALGLLLGWGHVQDHFQLFGRNAPSAEVRGAPISIASWNVRLFDLYNWSHNKETHARIFERLKVMDADILCLQEFFHSPDTRFFRTRTALLEDFRYTNVHDAYSQKAKYEQHFGIATFSVWPIVAKGNITFPDNPNNQCIWSDIRIGEDTIRVYNAHLASYHFGDDDYKFIEALDTDTKGDDLKRGGLRILKRLRRGFRLRATEVERIAEHMSTSPHPVVYCGDMNDVPLSYSYHALRQDRADAFRESGRGTGGTYVGRLPNLRIDHVLHDRSIESWGFATHPEELSDHRAVSCTVGLKVDRD